MKTVWGCDFTEIEPIDIGLQNEIQDGGYYVDVLVEMQKQLSLWINKKNENQEGEGDHG